MRTAVLERLSRQLLERQWITGFLAMLLLAASLLLTWQWERQENAEQVERVGVQARILAGSLAGALAFDDAQAAQEHLDAFRLDRRVRAVGVYGTNGRPVAGFARGGERLPGGVSQHEPRFTGRQLTVVQPVREGDLKLGAVYLRVTAEPLAVRLSRYLAIGIILVLAALLIAILGAANAAAAAANRRLQEQIAAREQAETQLRQAQKMEALGQLTGGVAHDFNNLLMAASSGLELMGRAKDEQRREKLKAGIRDALDRGARITEQLLAFSRRRPVQRERVDLRQHMGKLGELLDHSLRENISVRFNIADDLWPVETDISQFDVAILNLAVNAKDAMPDGGILCIAARNRRGALQGQDGVEISVEDEGTGMSAEAIEKAFEPFFTTKEVGRGTGLGLSQVYGFAHAAGGTVCITSRPGEGTTVTLLLPRSAAADAPSEDETEVSGGSGLQGVRILLVEDDASLNELIAQMLAELGAQVTTGNSAAEGLRLFDTCQPQAVLSDMVMPGGMGGLDLARGVRKKQPDFPVVLMTGYSDAAEAAAAEGFPVLRKPFTIAALGTCLKRILSASPR